MANAKPDSPPNQPSNRTRRPKRTPLPPPRDASSSRRPNQPDQAVAPGVIRDINDVTRRNKERASTNQLETIFQRQALAAAELFERAERANQLLSGARVQRYDSIDQPRLEEQTEEAPENQEEAETPDQTDQANQTGPSAVDRGKNAVGSQLKNVAGNQVKKAAVGQAEKLGLKAAAGVLTGGLSAEAEVGIGLVVWLGKHWKVIAAAFLILVAIIVVIVGLVISAAFQDPAQAGTSPIQQTNTGSTVQMTSLQKTLAGGIVTADLARQVLADSQKQRAATTNPKILAALDAVDRAANAIIAADAITDPTKKSQEIAHQSALLKQAIQDTLMSGPVANRVVSYAEAAIGSDNTLYYENPNIACASFVSTILKRVGALPPSCDIIRSTTALSHKLLSIGSQQIIADNTPISSAVISQLVPGDIVLFFRSNGSYIHSSIYVGNGNIVATSSSAKHVAQAGLLNYQPWRAISAFRLPEASQ